MLQAIRPGSGLLFGFLLLLSGCAGLQNGAQPIVRLQQGDIVSDNGALQNIRSTIESDCLNIATPVAEARARRNRLVSAYIFAVDLAYYQYERNLLDSIRDNDLGAASASLLLSSIGSVIGDQNLARALSTTNSIVTGTHTAIDRDYLLNQTITVLQTQMRANRATQRALIITRRALDYEDWDSCMALSDVLAFEQSGTLNGALASVAADAASAQRQGEQQARDAVAPVAFARDPLVLALNNFIFPSDRSLWSERTALANGIISDLGLMPSATAPIGIRRQQLLRFDTPAAATDRLRLARAILQTDSVSEALKAPIRAAMPPS